MNPGVLAYIVAASCMEYLDTTVIATALPQTARSFSVGPNEVSLGMSAYMLTLAIKESLPRARDLVEHLPGIG